MTNSSQSDENFKPICHGSPRPLLVLASMKTALNIWIQKFNEFYQADNDPNVDITKLDFHIEESTAIPTKIRKLIDAQMYPIAKELDKWVRSTHLSFDQIFTRFNLVVFGGNGTIHLRDTVANYLEDDTLDNLTRFEIACDNCVEEKIDFFWPLVSDTLSVDNLQFDRDFMMYYWICWKKGELRRIPLRFFRCIEHRMISQCRSFSSLATEYFLKSLNTKDRVMELDLVLPYSVRISEAFTRLFRNIDGPKQRQILNRYPARVLEHFVVYSLPGEYDVQCFLYICNIITPKCYCREIIIKYIKYLDLRSYTYDMSAKENILWCKQIETALEQIWLNTPPHLKEYALQNLSTILDEYKNHSGGSLRNFSRDIRFLLAVLSDCNFSLRNSLWIEYWDDWLIGVSPCQLEELMGLCLKTEAIEEFKSTLPYTEEFQRYCELLFSAECFIEFDTFLSSFYTNSELILNIKKHILTNMRIFEHQPRTIEKYVNYIDNLFSDVVLAADFKDHFIFSDPIIKDLFIMGTTSRSGFDNMKFFLSLFVSPLKSEEMKNKFLELFRVMVTSGKLNDFNESLWSEFVLWCLDNDEQRVEDFMKSLQIDVVFEAAFLEGLKLVENQWGGFMGSLCRFLAWFFKSKPLAEDYIRNKVEYYVKMNAADVERIFGKDEQNAIDTMTKYLVNNF